MSSLLRKFSHIYVERDAYNFEEAHAILKRFPAAETIDIDSYKEVFNRPRQEWRMQKESQKLILAVRKENFLYEGSRAAPDFGHEHFYYNSLALNCLYDCEYCYLQGMYPSANLVLFVNNNDYFRETERTIAELGSLYLCLSYDTDLLALEGLLPYCRRWIEFTRKQPDLTVEIRTKSVAYKLIQDIRPCERAILAWTLSPQEITERYEGGTPALLARIEAIEQASTDGWPVRLCFDPVVFVDGWRDTYGKFFRDVMSRLAGCALKEIYVGSFRMNAKYFRRAKSYHPRSMIWNGTYQTADQLTASPSAERADLERLVRATFSRQNVSFF